MEDGRHNCLIDKCKMAHLNNDVVVGHSRMGNNEGISRVCTGIQGGLCGADTAVGDGADVVDVHTEGVTSRHKEVG